MLPPSFSLTVVVLSWACLQPTLLSPGEQNPNYTHLSSWRGSGPSCGEDTASWITIAMVHIVSCPDPTLSAGSVVWERDYGSHGPHTVLVGHMNMSMNILPQQEVLLRLSSPECGGGSLFCSVWPTHANMHAPGRMLLNSS